ncbi:hypothetical protein VTO73DRAFT_9029 [Trametes versicolor]
MQATYQKTLLKRMCGDTIIGCGTRFQSGISGVSPTLEAPETTGTLQSGTLTSIAAPSASETTSSTLPFTSSDQGGTDGASTLSITISTAVPTATASALSPSHSSAVTSTATSKIEVITSPSVSPASTNGISIGYQPPLPPPSIDGQSSPLPAPSRVPQSPPLSAPSATSAAPAPSHRPRLPTPALVGAILASLFVTAIVAALVYLCIRRRRARAHALLPTQITEPDQLATTARATDSATGQPSRVSQKYRVEEVVSPTGGYAHPYSECLASGPGSSRGATIFERPPSSRPPTPDLHVGHKDHDALKDETTKPHPSPPVSAPVPSSTEEISTFARRAVSEAAPEVVTGGAHGERLLHLALPWVFGQRVLAMMAGEDARSVDSDGSEPLPAYAPRG